MDPNGLHIINGAAAAGSWRASFPEAADRLLIQHDLLSCGPIPLCDDLQAWKRVRTDYLVNLVPDSDQLKYGSFPLDLVGNLARLRDNEKIYVWAQPGCKIN